MTDTARRPWLFWATVAFSALALAASAMLFVDYVRPAPVFCAPDGGCGLVRQTAFAYPLGVPLPAIGVLGSFAMAVSGLIPGRRARLLHLLLAAAGGLVGVTLICAQLWLGMLCPYCIVVDVASVVLALLAIVRVRSGYEPPLHFPSLAAASALLVLSTGVPLVLGGVRDPVLPEVVSRELRGAPAGQVTVVDFVDFECPYCRENHALLAPLLDEHRDRVRVVRKHVPLRMHRHAQHAARAACCGEALGKPDEIAEALFAAAPDTLTPEGCERIAAAHGLPLERFRACVRDPATDARIRADAAAFQATRARGLPTVWIGEQRLEGLQDHETLRKAFDEALRAL